MKSPALAGFFVLYFKLLAKFPSEYLCKIIENSYALFIYKDIV